MQQTPSPIEQIKILYTNTNLPAALYGADGSVIWQNAAALYLAQLFPCEEWSAAAVRETAARIAGNSGQPLSYQTVSLAYYTLTVLPLAPEGPFLITYLPGAREPETPDLMPALLAGNAHLRQIVGSLFSAVLGLCNVEELYEDKQGYPLIRQINRDCQRLLGSGENLELYARLSAGQSGEPEVFDLTAHLEDLSRALTSKLRLQPGIDYSDKFCKEPLAVRIDPHQLDCAVLNLVDNSLQALMESEAATLRLSLRHSGDEAVITLTDNGPSLPAEYAEQVFEPFFSLDESRRSLGLGLTVTRMILERADGRVMASFREGYGTTISLILPLQPGLELRSGKLPSASADYFARDSVLHTLLSDIIEPPMP